MNYVYDEQGQLLGEYDSNGAPVYETIYLNTTPVGVLKQTGSVANNNLAVTLYNVYADHIDTPRVITKQDHTIVWRWDTAEAFGATAPDQNPSGVGVFVLNQRGRGQVFDQETGLIDNVNRTLNQRWGRYTQFDPLGLDAGINGYTNVHNDPVNFADPDGLFEWGDPLPNELVNVCAGFGDGVSLGITSVVRMAMGTNDAVDTSSPEYWGGVVAGAVVTGKGYAAGAELSIGRNFRFAPWGNRTGHPIAKYPHYHRRGAPDANGNTPPGQGIGRHRPWEKKSTDTCGCDRF